MNCRSRFAAGGGFIIGPEPAFLALLVTLALSGAANARGQFGPPFILSGALASCAAPQLAINADGDAIFTWERAVHTSDGFPDLRAQARTRSRTGVFGPILTLSGRSVGVVDSRVAMDAAGNALVVWSLVPKGSPGHARPSHAQFRALSSTGVLGTVQEMSSVIPADSARLAMNSRGDADLLWRRPNNDQSLATMETRTRSAGGALGPIKSVSLSQDLFSPEVAMSRQGDAAFTWARRIDGVNPRTVIQARRVAAGGAFGQLHQNLSTGAAPKVAIDGQGNAIVTWLANVSGSTRVQMRMLPVADVLGPQQFISQGSGNTILLRLAMNPAGDAVFAYVQSDGSVPVAKASALSAGGGLAGPQRLSPSGFFTTSADAAIDAHGRSLFVWSGAPSGVTAMAQSRTRSATGTLGAVHTLNNANAAFATSVAMNTRGDAAAVWCEFEQPASGDPIFTVHGAVTPVP